MALLGIDRLVRHRGSTATEPERLTSIPNLLCPFDDAIHPLANELNQATTEWLLRHRLYRDEGHRQRLVSLRPGLLVARVLPFGVLERMSPVVDFHTWLFAFDDAYCDEGGGLADRPAELAAVLAGLLRILDDPEARLLCGNPFADALRDIRARLGRLATDRQLRRWIEAVRGYFSHQVWEAVNRVEGRDPSVEEYALLRLHSGAMLASIALLDVAEGTQVAQADLDRDQLRHLVEMTCMLVGWDNDIFSYGKEADQSAQRHNLLYVLMSEHGESLSAALRRAVDYRNDVMRQFLRIAADTNGAATPTQRFVASLGRWIHANIAFSSTATRYATHPVEFAGCATLVGERAEARPPIEALSGWWSRVDS